MASQEVQLEKRGAAAEGRSLQAAPLAMWMRLRSAWLSMSSKQRTSAATAVVLLAAMLAISCWYGIRTDWRTLYSGLDGEDARQVGILLTQAQIPFELTDNGLTLRVPSTQLDKARLAT